MLAKFERLIFTVKEKQVDMLTLNRMIMRRPVSLDATRTLPVRAIATKDKPWVNQGSFFNTLLMQTRFAKKKVASYKGQSSRGNQRRQQVAQTREVLSMPKKGSLEWKQMQAERYERKKELKRKQDGTILGDELTPIFVSSMIFGAAIP